MNEWTDRFLELSFERLDLDDVRVDLVTQFSHQSMVILSLRPQLLHQTLQLPVLGQKIAATPLLRLQLCLHVAQLSITHVKQSKTILRLALND